MFFDETSKSLITDSEFSESVIIEDYDDGEDVTTAGLYSDTYMEVSPETGAEVMVDSPNLTLYYNDLKSDYGDITNGMYVQVRSQRFRIKKAQDDGTGVIFLVLKDA